MVSKALTVNQLGSLEELADAKTRVMALLKITTTSKALRNPTEQEAAEIVQYAYSIGANPFRDIHVWEQKKDGKTHLIKHEDYTLLVRWANQEMAFTPYYRHLTPQEKTENGYADKDEICYCYVLRNDNRAAYTTIYTTNLKALLEGGIGAREAMQFAKYETLEVMATRGFGVFKANEPFMVTGKSRAWRAETRALRAALRVSHRRPSPLELAQLAWRVNETSTQADDWKDIEVYKTNEERERAAELSAWNRETGERFDDLPLKEKRQKFAQNVQAMRGPDDEPGIGDEPEAVEDGEFSEATEAEFPVDDPDFPVDPETGEWDEQLANAGDVEQPETIVYDGPTSPREFTALVNEERERQKMKPFEELKDLSSFLKTRDLANGGAWPKTPEGWGKAWQAATAKE